MQELAGFKTTPKRFPISVKMYHLMAENGIFAEDDHVELIEGEIIDMSPVGNLHARCVKFLANYLISLLQGQYIVGVQDPVILNDFSEPEPDISILRFREDFYKNETPGSKDTVLVIEVADSSADIDRKLKAGRYAAAGIVEFWLVDLANDLVEIHSGPKSDGYGRIDIYRRGENAASKVIPAIDLPVNDILG